MADYAMVFPETGSTFRTRKTERRTVKSITAILRKWYTGSRGISQRMYGTSFSVIADPKTGAYERMY